MIATFSVGFDHIDLNECVARNIRVCNCPYEDSGESLYFIVEYQGTAIKFQDFSVTSKSKIKNGCR
jgi:hypothetical protein